MELTKKQKPNTEDVEADLELSEEQLETVAGGSTVPPIFKPTPTFPTDHN